MPLRQYSERAKAVPGLNSIDFRRIAEAGFDDPYNSYPHSMAWFNGHLYVGTTRACLAHRGRRRYEENPDLLGAGIWPVRIPKGLFDIDLRAQIWRYDPESNEWEKVFTSPMVLGTNGEETPLTIALRSMVVFQGKHDPAPALYVPTMGSRFVPESVMLRSYDGVKYDIVSDPGMGFPKPYRPRGVRATIGFQSRLFTSPAVGQIKGESNIAGFMVIGVNEDPGGGEWQIACEPHFGNRNNLTVFEMEAFNGFLYAGTMNVNEGFEIWKTDASGDPPYTWNKVIANGAYRGQLNQIVLTLRAFGDYLYVGTAVQEGGYDQANGIGPAAAEIIRIGRDDSWDLVVGDSRLTPDGLKVPLSGLGAGFGKPFAGYIWAMCVHEGWLYAGTLDWLVHLQFSDTSNWPKDLRMSLPKQKMEQLLRDYSGFDLWRTRDGNHWVPITQNGFGNPFNNGIRTMASSPHGLFVGSTNPYGPEVAVERIGGWQYEKNARGGLEIWFGSRHHVGALCSRRQESDADASDFKILFDGDDDFQPESFLALFYENLWYRNFGFWKTGITDIGVACENLIEEVQAMVPDKSGDILELDCGLGACTAYLLKYYSADCVTGVSFDKEQLEFCRKNVEGVNFRHGSPGSLKLAGSSCDCVTWVKGIGQPVTSVTQIREALRVLKPGGTLACFDVLTAKPHKRQLSDLLSAPLETLQAYRRALDAAGFEAITIEDVTAQTLDGFRTHRARFLDEKVLLGELDDEAREIITAFFLEMESPVSVCLLVSARKPEGRK